MKVANVQNLCLFDSLRYVALDSIECESSAFDGDALDSTPFPKGCTKRKKKKNKLQTITILMSFSYAIWKMRAYR